MKTFGYSKKENLNEDGLMEMEEISISASRDELRKIGEFFLKCAEILPDTEELCHEHYNDNTDEKSETDLIVVLEQ